MTIALAILAEIFLGVVITTVIAAIKPKKFLNESKNFRYGLAIVVIVGYPLSVLLFLIWALTWLPRYFVRRGVDKAARQE